MPFNSNSFGFSKSPFRTSPYTQSSDDEHVNPIIGDNFLLLDGSNFLLLDGTNFNLLGD